MYGKRKFSKRCHWMLRAKIRAISGVWLVVRGDIVPFLLSKRSRTDWSIGEGRSEEEQRLEERLSKNYETKLSEKYR